MRWYGFQHGMFRLPKPPWTGRTWRKRLSEWTGVVVATSEFGIKVVDGGGWLNWSLPKYRGTPFDTVGQGDRVRIEYAEVEKDGKKQTYISVIENLSRPQESSPFPPEEDFLPQASDYGPAAEPDAPGAPPEGAVTREQSIIRQCCVKAAGMALQHNMGNAQEKAGQMTYLAGVLEDWVNR